MCIAYGLKSECEHLFKTDEQAQVWQAITDVFGTLRASVSVCV